MLNKVDIEDACTAENIQRFTQANSTPSLTSDQVDLIGWTANTDGADFILYGHQDTRLHPLINNLVPYLRIHPAIREQGLINQLISTEEFCDGWKKCKEYTRRANQGFILGTSRLVALTLS